MKYQKKLTAMIVLPLALGLLAVGCSQSPTDSKVSEAADQTPTASAKAGCCSDGNCATSCVGNSGEKTSADANKVGCCGKCQDNPGCTDECADCADQPVGEGESKAGQQVNTRAQDRDIFHFLLQNHDQITRTVTEIPNGVRTVTESTDTKIAKQLQEHVASMKGRVEDGRPMRMWDDLYREVFKHADKIEMKIENTENGIQVIETSDDPYVAKLIKAHAKVVSGFAKRGFEEARENHAPPQK